jgi:hypothetical protein
MAIQIFAKVDPHLLRRMRKEIVYEILDPYKTGQLDPELVTDLEESASVEISMALLTAGGVYKTFTEPFVKSLEMLAIDMMVGRLGERQPALVGVDHVSILASTRDRLKLIRTGKMSLGEEPPDPAANHGGVVMMGCAKKPLFSNNGSGKWGIY